MICHRSMAAMGVTVAMAVVLSAAMAGVEAPATQPGMAPLPFVCPRPGPIPTPKKPVPGVRLPASKPRPPFYAPVGTKNIALNRPVTSSDKEPVLGELKQITDGEKQAAEGACVELSPGVQWVQIDLGSKSTIHAILMWHKHADMRAYKDVVVQVCDDQDFINSVKTVFNNDTDGSAGLGVGKDQEYYEYHEGELIDCKGVSGRYVRCYCNGSTNDGQNHYTEIEVWGIAAK